MNTTTLRTKVEPRDAESIKEIVASTDFFNQEEIEIAVELVLERLQKGEASGYFFVFADISDSTIGYACFGLTPGTAASADLYWIAVHRDFRGKGVGKLLLQESEKLLGEMGGHRIYIETSSRDLYIPTRQFYLSNHYQLVAQLEDYYAPGDDKCIFVKKI
ncbi:MAG: GNAT family N-acetyltransferase [Calditrichaeota bacterium]|nr:MAG: GNAT family N-acetyltransferase [Calditrichota bacterium]